MDSAVKHQRTARDRAITFLVWAKKAILVITCWQAKPMSCSTQTFEQLWSNMLDVINLGSFLLNNWGPLKSQEGVENSVENQKWMNGICGWKLNALKLMRNWILRALTLFSVASLGLPHLWSFRAFPVPASHNSKCFLEPRATGKPKRHLANSLKLPE